MPVFLAPYGYLASNPREWPDLLAYEKHPDLSIRVTSHTEVDRHTQYHVECSITWPSKDGTHATLTWGVDRRLLHFRLGLHDPIKRELRSSYGKLFRDAHFAQRYGPKGTTEKLNRWCCRLAHCINSRTLPPIAVMFTLKALNAPSAPSSEPCRSSVRLATSESTAASWSKEDSGSYAGSDLGLSDAETLEDASIPDGVDAFYLDEPDECADLASDIKESGTNLCLSDDLSSCEDAEVCVQDAGPQERCVSLTVPAEAFSGSVDASLDEGVVMAPLRLEALQQSEVASSVEDEELGETNKASPRPNIAGKACEHLVDSRSTHQIKLRPCRGSEPLDHSESSMHVTLRPCLANESNGRQSESGIQVKLRPCSAEASVDCQEHESGMQAKLRARKQIVDVQKISGRGMLF